MFSINAGLFGIFGKHVAGLLSILCIIGIVFTFPSTALAAEQQKDIDKLVHEWKELYGESCNWQFVGLTESEKEETTKKVAFNGTLSQGDLITQTQALRSMVKAVVQSCELSPSELAAHRRFITYVMNGETPY